MTVVHHVYKVRYKLAGSNEVHSAVFIDEGELLDFFRKHYGELVEWQDKAVEVHVELGAW